MEPQAGSQHHFECAIVEGRERFRRKRDELAIDVESDQCVIDRVDDRPIAGRIRQGRVDRLRRAREVDHHLFEEFLLAKSSPASCCGGVSRTRQEYAGTRRGYRRHQRTS